MKHVFSFIVGAVLLSTVWAAGLPNDSRLTFLSDSGIVMGVGVLHEGKLTLTLQGGFDGFITLLIEGADGTVVSQRGLITASGQVLLTTDGAVEDLAQLTEAAGGELNVTFEDRIAQGVKDIAALPEPAQAGIAGAISNHAEAQKKAAEGKAHAGVGGGANDNQPDHAQEKAAEGRAHAGASGGTDNADHPGPDVDVEIGIGSNSGPNGAGRP